MKEKVFSILALLCITASSAWAGQQPKGVFEEATGNAGSVTVKGWAYDPDANSSSITIHVYVWQKGVNEGDMEHPYSIQVVEANVERSDVNTTEGITGNHGFQETFSIAAGKYVIKAFGLDKTGGDSNKELPTSYGGSEGKREVTVSAPTNSYAPRGYVDECTGQNGSIRVRGWALDEDNLDVSLWIHIYVDETHVKTIQANIPSSQEGILNHYFDTYVEATTGSHYVRVFALNIKTDGSDNGAEHTQLYGMPGGSFDGVNQFNGITVSDPYAITYNVNGGSGSVASQDKRTGINLTLASSGFTRTGYTLDGWATSAGGDKAYDLGATYTGNAALSLYAHWTKNEVTLTDGVNLSASGLTGFVGKQCDVSYTRSFNVGKTSTVCLPFAYTKQGTEGSFYEFTSITEEGGEYVATMTEPVSTTLAANTPYLFTPALSSVTFTGTITEVPATFTAGETVKTPWTFKGTFATIEWDGTQKGTYGFSAQNVGENISQGEFVKVGEYVRIKPMRCYLVYTGSDANWAAARGMNRVAAAEESLPETIKVRLIGANGDITAIGTLHTQTGEVELDGWYTLDGTRLSGQPTRKGIYVNNGKKVIIK